MSDEQFSFLDEVCDVAHVSFIPNREAGLDRLNLFAPYAGRLYASSRNFDLGPDNRSNISALSPWIRHRLISEEEVLRETLKAHSFKASEKFLQEVFWRAYFKGWLEQRPDVWRWYCDDLKTTISQLEKDRNLNQGYQEAITGKTGIEAFDHWAKELVETGYLHNHARMWFASIWVFTLKLPWQLGADFFYRHLLDGDAASNTCSWRWVGGLHTKGKNYAASSSNIARFTNGRFSGDMKLARNPLPLNENRDANLVPSPIGETIRNEPYILLVTEEDCLPETLNLNTPPVFVAGLLATENRSILEIGKPVKDFAKGAMQDALLRAEKHFGVDTKLLDAKTWADSLADIAGANNISTLVTAYTPVGTTADTLNTAAKHFSEHNLKLVHILRDYDASAWPHATKGFFKLKKKMPYLIQNLNLS